MRTSAFISLCVVLLQGCHDDPVPRDAVPGEVPPNTNENNVINTNDNEGTANENGNGNGNEDDHPTAPVGAVNLGVLETRLEPPTMRFGESAALSVVARVSATDATVEAVEARASFAATVSLRDDGIAPDDVAEDGLYRGSTSLGGDEAPGSHAVEIVAQGTDIEGNAVSARRTLSFVVAEGYRVRESAAGALTSIASQPTAESYGSGLHAIALPFAIEFYGETFASGSAATLSDDGHLTFNARDTYVDAKSADAANAVSGGAPGIAVHNSSTFISTVYSVVEGEAPDRRWVLEWSGSYLGGGTGAFQLRFTEGSAGFYVHYGEMIPEGNPDWALVAVLTGQSFNEVYTATTAPALDAVSETAWDFTPP